MRTPRSLWSLIAVSVVCCVTIPVLARADATREPELFSPPHSAAAPIAYRVDEHGGLGVLAVRVVGALLLVSALGVAVAFAAKRFMPSVRGFSLDGTRRVQLLESHRITPRLTLYVIAFEGRTVLLAQSGDRLIDIDAHRRGRAADAESTPTA
jgi:flagellar biogenesis protein FliO